jgi:cephalosporin hydroxylase
MSDFISGWEKIQGWTNFAQAYRTIVRRLPANRPSTFVEVGTWKGRSFAMLGELVVRSGKPITIVGVDTFKGSDEDAHRNDPDISNLRQLFDRNLAPVKAALGERMRVLEMSSIAAAAMFTDRSVDAVWLDGGHEYEDVRDDIKAWLPKLVAGGYLGGDDYEWVGVRQAVDEAFGERALVAGMYPWWVYETPATARR